MNLDFFSFSYQALCFSGRQSYVSQKSWSGKALERREEI